MGCIYRRGERLWIRFKGANGKWTQQKTPHLVGAEGKARKLLLEVEAQIAAGVEFAPASVGPIRVRDYAKRWLIDRRGLIADWKRG